MAKENAALVDHHLFVELVENLLSVLRLLSFLVRKLLDHTHSRDSREETRAQSAAYQILREGSGRVLVLGEHCQEVGLLKVETKLHPNVKDVFQSGTAEEVVATEFKGGIPPLTDAEMVPLIENTDNSEVIRVGKVRLLGELKRGLRDRDSEGGVVPRGESSMSRDSCISVVERMQQRRFPPERGCHREDWIYAVEEAGVDEHFSKLHIERKTNKMQPERSHFVFGLSGDLWNLNRPNLEKERNRILHLLSRRRLNASCQKLLWIS
jgi:hypothetical protein